MIDVHQSNAAGAKTKIDGMKRQFIRGKGNGSLAVLDMGEPLFLSRRKDSPIFDETGGRIVKRGVNPQCVQATLLSSALTPPAS
jgi:hypothetical protein